MKEFCALLFLFSLAGLTFCFSLKKKLNWKVTSSFLVFALLGSFGIANYDIIRKFKWLGAEFETFQRQVEGRIENVETLVENLYSRTCFETINGFDSDRVFIQQLGGDRKRLFLKLEHVPLKRSIQCLSGGNPFMQNSGVASFSPMGHCNNIVYSGEITGDGDLRSLTYIIQYVKDVQKKRSVSKVEFQGQEVMFDGTKTPLEKME